MSFTWIHEWQGNLRCGHGVGALANVRPRADNVLRFFVPLEVDVHTEFFHAPMVEQLVFAQPPVFLLVFHNAQ